MRSQSHRLNAGTAQIEITPPVGVDLSGYVARSGPSIGVHDALYARALVVEDGQTRLALVVCDLIGLPSVYVTAARRAISTATGIPEAALMITCTHTHSGPATLCLHECGTVNPSYLDTLHAKLVDVVSQATVASQLVEAGVEWGALPDGLYNRRGDGSPVDASVGVAHLRARDRSRRTVAVLTTYGCHPVVLEASNRLVSADYPGSLVGALEDTLGGSAFFLTGACGNVDPVRRGSFTDVQWLGQALGEQALQVIPRILYDESPLLAVDRELLALPLQAVPSAETLKDEIVECRQILTRVDAASTEARIQRAMLAWAESTLAQVQAGEPPETVEAEVQGFRLGPLSIVGVPGELFSDLGLQIRAGGRVPRAMVFVAGYANGDVGYIPDCAAYTSGGYEVSDAYKYYGYPAALGPGAGTALVAAARRLLTSLNN